MNYLCYTKAILVEFIGHCTNMANVSYKYDYYCTNTIIIVRLLYETVITLRNCTPLLPVISNCLHYWIQSLKLSNNTDGNCLWFSHQALQHRDFVLWLSAEVAASLGSRQLAEDWQRHGVCVPHTAPRTGVSQPSWAAAQMWWGHTTTFCPL